MIFLKIRILIKHHRKEQLATWNENVKKQILHAITDNFRKNNIHMATDNCKLNAEIPNAKIEYFLDVFWKNH